MPHWAGWKLVDDDTRDDNSQCNSALIDAMLAPPAQAANPPASQPNLSSPPAPAAQQPETAQTTPEQKASSRKQNLCKPAVQERLARTICKFPTEWARREVRSRWEWTRKTGNLYMPYPLEDEADFTEMADFAQKLCFWEELPAEDRARLTEKHWHFHPREFIIHFRQSGWLSERELKQLFPQVASRNSKKGWVTEPVSPSRQGIGDARLHLNRAARKYLITTPTRIAAFYGNAMQETTWFATMQEGDGANARYAPWYGRGFLQLTWPANYIKYARFRGISVSAQVESHLASAQKAADRTRSSSALQALEGQVPSDLADLRTKVEAIGNIASSDSAGAYWAWSEAAQSADVVAPFIRAAMGVITYYTHAGFGNVAATVNVGHPSTNFVSVNGIHARFQAYTTAFMVLADRTQFPDAQGQMQERPEGWARRLP